MLLAGAAGGSGGPPADRRTTRKREGHMPAPDRPSLLNTFENEADPAIGATHPQLTPQSRTVTQPPTARGRPTAMSTSIGSVTSKQKDPIPVSGDPSPRTDKAAKEKKPAMDLNAQPSSSGPADVKAFYDQQTQPKVSADCSSAVVAGKSPAEMSAACTVREFAAMANQPKSGATPVTTDPECVRDYEKEGAAWGEAAGEEAKDQIKKVPVPIVRHRVAKAVKEALQEKGKELGRTEGAADCKVVTDPVAFAKNHSSIEVANQSKAPPAAEPSSNFTPADPSKAMSKAK